MPLAVAVTLFMTRHMFQWCALQRRGISRSRKGTMDREKSALGKI